MVLYSLYPPSREEVICTIEVPMVYCCVFSGPFFQRMKYVVTCLPSQFGLSMFWAGPLYGIFFSTPPAGGQAVVYHKQAPRQVHHVCFERLNGPKRLLRIHIASGSRHIDAAGGTWQIRRGPARTRKRTERALGIWGDLVAALYAACTYDMTGERTARLLVRTPPNISFLPANESSSPRTPVGVN